MKLPNPSKLMKGLREGASVLVIVLWISIGLVSIALYFANSMNYELTAADNRVSGLTADQAIEGAARYVGYALSQYATNGAVPDNTQFKCAAVPVGDAKFWIIGRDPSGDNSTEPYFSLIDEGSKLNLNTANTNTLSYLPNMTMDFAQAIMDWRGTNGVVSLDYSSLGYLPKNAPFETVDELRLVYGATVNLLAGDDLNRNGVLDANEKDTSGTGQINYGLLEYTTVWTREPNFHSDGTTLTNVNTANVSQLTALFRDDNVSSPDTRANAIYTYTHPGGRTTPPAQVKTFHGIFDFACVCRQSGMSDNDFASVFNDVTTSTNTYFRGRVNVNTANADVLTALFEGLNNGNEQTAEGDAQTLINYREQNPDNLGSIAWVYDALGSGNATLTALRGGDYITTHSFQFTADIAAVGPFERGYRRVKFIFDVSDGTPKILYRQDLSRLGWALGEKARENLIAKDTP
jgi:DNA uptake protein ComE-like DNA-binding protein